MIPLIGILLSIYLVFKGFEIFQIALSNPERPAAAIVIGVLAMIASVVIALFFGLTFLSAGTTNFNR